MRVKREDGYYLGKHRGSYCAALYIGGTRQSRLTFGTTDGEEATRRIRELNIKRQCDRAARDLTVDAIFDLYIADREKEGKAAVYRMKQCQALLKRHFGALLPDMIDKALCHAYMNGRRNLNVGDSTIRTELTYLSVALNFAVDTKLILSHPRIWRPPPGRPRSHMGDYHLTRTEADQLLRAAEQTPHLRLWIIVALATAGRPLHILQLTWARVDFYRGTINLDDPERDRTPKGRALVPMNDEVRAALIDARRHSSGSPYVIEWNGQPMRSVKKALARAAARAEVKASPYVLRHTAAVWMAEAGVPIPEIAQILGHTNIETTRRIYARFSPGFLRNAVSTLQVVRGSVGTQVPAIRNVE